MLVYHLISVVGLQHVAHSYDGLLVWIQSAHGTDVVQRGGLSRVAVGSREIQRHNQRNLAAALNKLPRGRDRNSEQAKKKCMYIGRLLFLR